MYVRPSFAQPEIPNPKLQQPKKFEAPIFKSQANLVLTGNFKSGAATADSSSGELSEAL
jgi:hypothetical protein